MTPKIEESKETLDHVPDLSDKGADATDDVRFAAQTHCICHMRCPLPWLSRIFSSSGFTGSRREAVREHAASARLELYAHAVSASGNPWHRSVTTQRARR